MILKAIFWLILVYIAIIILWRLFVSVMMIIEGYKDGGVKGGAVGFIGALRLNLLMILGDIWGLIKYAIGALIVVFIVRACSS